MSAPEVSIVMAAHDRAAQLARTLQSIYAQRFSDFEVIVVEDGDDGGATLEVCARFDRLRYIRRHDRPDVPYSNQAVPMNIGMRAATGRVLILQNAECEHVSPEVIAGLAAPHFGAHRLAVFASVFYAREDGAPELWGSHPARATSPYFFCGSILRERALLIGGMNEAFKGGGAEDDEFAARLEYVGTEFRFLPDVIVRHQWHPPADRSGLEENRALFEAGVLGLRAGWSSPVANTEPQNA